MVDVDSDLLGEVPVQAPADAQSPANATAIRVILADSQAIYRVGMRKVFALEDDVRVVAQVENLVNLRSAIERYPSDIVLLEGTLLVGTTDVIPDLLQISPRR